jgi:multisubunit Na+/H+ antiporter MnhG subunit
VFFGQTQRPTAKKRTSGKDSYMEIHNLLPATYKDDYPKHQQYSTPTRVTYGTLSTDAEDIEDHGDEHAVDDDADGMLVEEYRNRRKNSVNSTTGNIIEGIASRSEFAAEVVDEVSVAANTMNALLGVSLFAMPWGFQQSGVLGGLTVLIIVAILSYDTARMLLVSQKVLYMRSGEVKSYPQIAGSILGPRWSNVVKVATITSCLGGCTGYLIFFGETVGQALQLSGSTVILLATIPLILLSWIRSFRELTLFTVVGVCALIVAVIIIFIDGSHKLDRNVSDLPMFETNTFMNFIGPATFLFTIHYFLLAMGAEVLAVSPWISNMTHTEAETSYSALNYPIALSYFLSLGLIALVGVAGFAMYRNVDLVT